MSYPHHPGVPYTYYNPQQQLYYPYVYSYPYHPQGMPFMTPAHPQTPIDPSLLTGQPPPQPSEVPATVATSPTASYGTDDEESDEEGEGNEDRFALHPVPLPTPPQPPSSKNDDDDENENELLDDADDADGDYQEASSRPSRTRGSTSAPLAKLKESSAAPPAARRVPGPIGNVTGAPKQDDRGALSSEEIARFNSPVKTLKHIDLELFPSRAVFENILYTYQSNLSARKRNKALISRAAYAEIQMTLVEIRESRCRRGTAQYRFWVKKMFGIIGFYGHDVVGHQGKPVAIREDIYDILVHCHDQCDHGGRDRTVEVVKDFYRWIPKVIIGEFVKHCPGCSMKRATVKSETSKMPLYNLGDMDEMESMEPDEEDVSYDMNAMQRMPDDEMDEDD